MSSLYVRRLFEGWLQDPALQVPFHSTINEEQNPQEDIWCTADFSSGYREVLTFCQGTVSEDGEIEVVYFSRPGTGDDVLLQLIEADAALIEAMNDPAGKLTINGRSAPVEFSLGSARKDYSLSVFYEYQYFE